MLIIIIIIFIFYTARRYFTISSLFSVCSDRARCIFDLLICKTERTSLQPVCTANFQEALELRFCTSSEAISQNKVRHLRQNNLNNIIICHYNRIKKKKLHWRILLVGWSSGGRELISTVIRGLIWAGFCIFVISLSGHLQNTNNIILLVLAL